MCAIRSRVEFASKDEALQVLKGKSKLKGSNVFINPDYTRRQQELNKSAQQQLIQRRSNGEVAHIQYIKGSIEDARGKEVDNLEVESWVLELEINERPVEFKLDTGAMANVIPVSVLKPGKKLILEDTLSRAFENKEFDENIDIEIEAQVCLISMNLNITDEKRKEYIKQTDLDNELIALKNLIKEGWPRKKDTKKIFLKKKK
ncbi:hypothetical protein JTB14_000991 [Gonioctena quinquepunctata]|nr:hypothetical protein JTB14_000991 [Gonioctena quinquepunctata]